MPTGAVLNILLASSSWFFFFTFCLTIKASAIVFPAECFDAEAALKAVQEENCTALHGVPTMFISELEVLQRDMNKQKQPSFEYLRTGVVSGSSVPVELMRKLHRIMNLTQLSE
jgi:acyl-CoA synthetase (AMP-forming)/AMP-acid ligase II